ncbi:MAG: 50S ribosomal protein L19e [Candidatus Woesearchaeota archaeon]|jgi:large subunit ribosomal protein L19e
MNLNLQKRLAAKVCGRSQKKVTINILRYDDVKEAITKSDIRSLISDGAITIGHDKGISRFRAKARAVQRRKNKQKGEGRKKGKIGARIDFKSNWVARIRSQREFVRSIKDRLDHDVFRSLLSKIKGGYFRSIRHMKLYLEEHKLFNAKK